MGMKNITTLVAELRLFFKRRGASNSLAIANLTGINQSQIYRNLYGKPKRITKTLKELCKYAEVICDNGPLNPRENDLLMNTLADVWDGSERHAKLLAQLLIAHKRANM